MSNNDHLVLISGMTGTGKSASLMDIKDPEGVMYLNCEAGKKLPFPAKFMKAADGRTGFNIMDPAEVFECFDHADELNAHTIVIDTITYLMDMYESRYVLTSDDTRAAWQNYAQFYKTLMQQYVAKAKQNVIILGHTLPIYDETNKVMENKIPVKGALKNQGLESYFSLVVSTKKMKLADLADYENDLLTITEDDKLLGYKHVFQTRLTADTVNERIRSPMKMFSIKETFIDNDCQKLLDRIHQYYE